MIVAEHLYKRYYLYDSPWAKVGEMLGLRRAGARRREFWALKDVSLNVGRGRTLGVIGPNGAGKSTLLKMVTGITRPTGGSIRVEGRVAALLELGTGFHPEFTGRQNIHINGKMLGLSDAEIRAREDEIIAFAEIGPFIDQPLRTYSTGMAMRLGFATGAAARPDIFIIDEVLSVGDAYFSQKCHKKLEEIRESGTTILFVSHDMNAIVRLCDVAVLLNEGRMVAQGEPRDIIEYYTQLIAGRSQKIVESAAGRPRERVSDPSRRYGSREALITGIEMSAAGREGAGEVFVSGGNVAVRLRVMFLAAIENPTIGILIRDRTGYDVFGTNTVWMRQTTGRFEAGEQATFEFAFPLNLGPGAFTLTAAIHHDETHLEKCFDWIDQAYTFKVVDGADFRCYGAARLTPKLAIERRGGEPDDWRRTIGDLFAGAPAALGMDEGAERWLLAGWYAPERGSDGRVMRWTAEAALVAVSPRGGRLELECQAAGRLEPVEISLFELDRPLGTNRLEPGASGRLSWDVSGGDGEPGAPRVFRLKVTPGLGGKAGAGDPRRLGVLVFGIASESSAD